MKLRAMESQSTAAIYWLEAIERVAPDWDRIRELQQQIAALEQSPGWAALCELLRLKVDVLHASVLPPGVPSHGEYIGVTSQEFALLRALEVPEAVQIVFQREDEKQQKAAQRADRQRSTR